MFWKRGTHVAGYVRCRNFSNLPKRPPESPIRRVTPNARPTVDGTPQTGDSPHSVQYLKDVNVLGKPARVVIVNNQPSPARDASRENDSDKKAWSLSPAQLLEQLHKEKVDFKLEEVEENLGHLRSLYNPGHGLPPNDWKDLRRTLSEGFRLEQLQDYYHKFERKPEGGDQDGWRAGISPYMDQAPVPQSRVSTRILAMKGMSRKPKLAERIMRECWELSIGEEEGQLDVHLDERSLSVLLLPTVPLMNKFAQSHKVTIDVSRHLGLIRVTGNKESCIETRRQLKAWASEVQSMNISLPAMLLKSRADVVNWENTLLPWLQSKYNVSFDVDVDNNQLSIHYMHSANSDAHRARQALYLATNPPDQQDGLITNVPPSQGAYLYPVSCPDSMKFPDRQKEWLRWMNLEDGHGRSPGRAPASIYGKGPNKPFHELLELLFDASDSKKQSLLDPQSTREVITATVGQCLFESRSPSSNGRVTFTDIGTPSTPRTFVKEVPNTLAFLDTLDVVENKDDINSYRIRLLPSYIGLPKLPELELELEATLPGNDENVSYTPKIRRASAIISSRDVDMLLPEGLLDVRFNKTVYYDLFDVDSSEVTPNHATEDAEFLSSLHKCAEAFQLNLPLTRAQPPMPLFCNLTIPRTLAELLDSSPTSTQSTPVEPAEDANHIAGEYYIYPPVQSLAEVGVSRYIYKEFDITFGSQSMGPYLPTKTTDVSLTLGLHDNERRPQAALPNQRLSSSSQAESSTGSLQAALLPLYLRSCQLAFRIAAPYRSDEEILDDELFDEEFNGDI
ncbi:hypothetical protein FQN49_003125 [Arthroderma sp. PD_2]|nr:hypothetical protein FQN49_003125 [Arthroderma sp. PD_2]